MKMKALMKDNLIMRYQQSPEFDYRGRGLGYGAKNELLAIKQIHGMNEYFDLKNFLKSIEGREVELTFLGADALK